MNDLTNDQLVSELMGAIRGYYISATDEAKNNMKARIDALETALRARLAALEPLAQAAVAYADSKGKRWSEIESSIYVMCDVAVAFADMRAQAQDGAA